MFKQGDVVVVKCSAEPVTVLGVNAETYRVRGYNKETGLYSVYEFQDFELETPDEGVRRTFMEAMKGQQSIKEIQAAFKGEAETQAPKARALGLN